MGIKAVENVSKLTTIPEKNLARLQDIYAYVICDAVEDALLSDIYVSDIELGFGTLSIKFEDNELRFRFKPSAKFEEELIDTIVNKRNVLTLEVEKSLVSKIVQTYKDLM